MQIVPNNSTLLKFQQELPETLRQNHVLIKFAEPVRGDAVGQFILVRLTEAMKLSGEDSFFMAHIFQAHRVGKQFCSVVRYDENGMPYTCRAPLRQLGLYSYECTDPLCKLPSGQPSHSLVQHRGPVQGVIRVLYFPDWVCEVRQSQVGPVEHVRACLLQLDRRYNADTLCAITRTCHELAERLGWKLLN